MAVSGALLIGSLALGGMAIKRKQDDADSRNLINTVVGGDEQDGTTLDNWFDAKVRDKKTGQIISSTAHPLPLIKHKAQMKMEKIQGGPKRNKIPTVTMPYAQSGMLTNNQ